MILKVNHSELEEFANVLKNDATDYDKEIDTLLSLIEELRGVWKGTDAEEFYSNVTGYIKKMRGITSTMTTLSETSKSADRRYKEKDEEFGNALKEGAAKYES